MIDKPGIYQINADVYHADPCPEPSLSSSVARALLAQSPLHAWTAHPRLNPNYAETETSRFDLGSAAHALFLERDPEQVVVVDTADWRTKAAREAREAARADGKFAILAAHHADVTAMVERANEFLGQSELTDFAFEAERTVVWVDNEAWCRARPDLLALSSVFTDRACIVDYKTTDSAAPDAFCRQIGRMGYDVQAAFYQRGVQEAAGLNQTPVFVFLAQEITPPYACSLVGLSNTWQEIGARKAERAIETWALCMKSGRWPAYQTRIHYAEPPQWEIAEYEAALLADSGEWHK